MSSVMAAERANFWRAWRYVKRVNIQSWHFSHITTLHHADKTPELKKVKQLLHVLKSTLPLILIILHVIAGCDEWSVAYWKTWAHQQEVRRCCHGQLLCWGSWKRSSYSARQKCPSELFWRLQQDPRSHTPHSRN